MEGRRSRAESDGKPIGARDGVDAPAGEARPNASHRDPPDAVPVAPFLDPRTGDPAERGRIGEWLRLAHGWRSSPSRAVAHLKGDPDPSHLLADARQVPLLGPEPVERWTDELAAAGIRLVPFGSSAYPARLANLSDPPILLFLRGQPDLLQAQSVAIVGPRAPSAYGVEVAERIARAVALRGAAVVSGLARGIDAVAHRATLVAGGATVAVQACGPPAIYPPAHRDLAEEIAEVGALVWEMPPGTPPLAHLFPRRNRLISALSRVVVVVEARHRSGSLVTARHALDQGIPVMAVPGPIDRATSEGSNRLLRDGAHPLLDPEDLWSLLGWNPVPLAPTTGPGGASATLSADAESILAELLHGPALLDELCVRLRRTPQELALGLLDLELDGLVSPDRDGRYRATADSRDRR